MPLILAIETGSNICSVALARDGELLALRESEGRDHASRVAVFAQELLAECGVELSQLDAVALGSGPGSYTGLRIGSSFAKGLCYGLSIPLIAVGSLELLSAQVVESGVDLKGAILMPMIDARRMEVYMAAFNGVGEMLGQVEAKVIEEGSLAEYSDKRLIIFGSGAEKCLPLLPWAEMMEVRASARGIIKLAERRLKNNMVEDVAYFEPLYLKEFQVIPSKKRLF
ncbi:MAG: tRNA (adenosine(37)-N6)-threonylcarbamoyltransferase complex dimerization subunit type 1 TsaB [Rikenellaceae bacterium]